MNKFEELNFENAGELPDEDDYYDGEDEPILDAYCPNCHREYDEIDYEYQICHICKYNNDKP